MAKENRIGHREGDTDNRAHRLFTQEIDLVDVIAGRILRAIGAFAERDELIAAGRAGLLDAATRFEPSRGVPFRAYANIRIQGAIFDSMRQSARLPRRAYERLRMIEASTLANAGAAGFAVPGRSGPTDEAAQESALAIQLASGATAMLAAIASTDGFGGSSNPEANLAQNPEAAAQQAELARLLREAIDTLDEDEATIIRLWCFEELSTRQIARRLNVSYSWCFRLYKSATMRLTHYLQTFKTIE